MPTIEIIIDSHGNVEAETKGYAGENCLAATRFLEESLGEITGNILTPDRFLTLPEAQPQSEHQSGS